MAPTSPTTVMHANHSKSTGSERSSEFDTTLMTYLLRIADDHLVLSHRLSQWCGHAPLLEEDLALPNIALDLMGQARVLYTYAGECEGQGRDEDQLAYLRVEREFRNLLLVERPNGDFAHTMLKQLYFSVFMGEFWAALVDSTDECLRDCARKAIHEVTYHIRHSSEWIIRLGDGTDESTTRTYAAMDALAPYVDELFHDDAVTESMSQLGTGVNPSTLDAGWRSTIATVMNEARLETQDMERVRLSPGISGGRLGQHSEDLGFLLAEMQYLQRAYPGQQW